jgi:aminocarboxymuconate-semialdehyde decarboxylase
MERRAFLRAAAAGTGTALLPTVALAASSSTYRGKKIDAFSHFSFPSVLTFLEKSTGRTHPFGRLFANTKTLIDEQARLALMDRLGIDRHVLIPLPELGMTPQVESDPILCAQAARICNDEMASLVAKYPSRFTGIALVPTANADVMVTELERAVKTLKLRGGMVGTAVEQRVTPDDPQFEPLYSKCAELGVPLYLHPGHSPALPDYTQEQGGSKYQYFQAFSWLNDSTLAMTRIVFSGVFERYPNLKIVIHHHGALIPYFIGRLDTGIQFFEKMAGRKYDAKIRPLYGSHFKKFYIDTATQSYNPGALQLAIDYFELGRVMFGTDAPMDAEEGAVMSIGADRSVAQLNLNEAQQKQIYYENAERVLGIGA